MEAINNPSRIGPAAQKLKDGATELASAVAEKGSELTRTAIDKAADFKNVVVQKSTQAYEKCRDESEQYIKENPHRSVFYALGVGAVIGAITALLIVRARD